MALQNSDFVSLHQHSMHSCLDGILRLEDYADRLVEQGQVAGALTDHGQMSNVLKWYHLAQSKGLKPIIGCEFYMTNKTIEQLKEEKDKTRYHITLLAKNNDGYKNLCKLMYFSNKDNYYYKSLVTHELLEECTKGVICLSGCASGEIGEKLKIDDYEGAKEIALWLNSIFDDFYLELQLHGHPKFRKKWDVQTKINDYLDKLHKETGIPEVITADSHYLNYDDDFIHDVALCIGTASNLSDENRMSLKDFDLSVPDPKYVIELFGQTHEEAIKNTRKIADMCNVELDLDRYHVPQFKTPNGESDRDYLRHLAFVGCAKKLHNIDVQTEEESLQYLTDEEISRLNEELITIDKLDLNGYTLIVQEFLNWAKSNGIYCGAGRGSAAGSLVNYSINVTEINPLPNGLLFARYLNPGRLCFLPNQSITCRDAAKRFIQDIRPGQEVKTFDLTYHKVRRVFEIPVQNEKCVRIYLENGKKIECTENHRIWIKDKQWIKAKDLNVGDICITPRKARESEIIQCSKCHNNVKCTFSTLFNHKDKNDFVCSSCISRKNYEKCRININKWDENRKKKASQNMKKRWKKDYEKMKKTAQDIWTKERREAARQRLREQIDADENRLLKWKRASGRGSHRTIYYSERQKKDIRCDSSLEVEFCRMCEIDSSIKSFDRYKGYIWWEKDGIKRRYYPDFEVYYNDGRHQIIEVKAKYFRNDIDVQLKRIAAKKEFGNDYVILDEEEIRKNNVLLHNDVKIIKIEKFEYTGSVFDLEVENVHNYYVNGICVHNSMADVDSDIEDTRRDEVVQHLIDLYGQDNVIGIGTFGTLRAKNAIRDVARVLEYPFDKSLALTKLLPDAEHNGGNQLKNYLESDDPELEEFRRLYHSDKEVKRIVDIAIKLEGNIRNHGQHACGLIISPKPSYEYIPVERAQSGQMVSQLDMHECEEFGLIKYDLLGLANLSIIEDSINDAIEVRHL